MSYTIDNTENPEFPFMTSGQAAKHRGVTRQHIVRLCQQSRIPGATQIGCATWLVPRHPDGGFIELDSKGEEVRR